MVELQLSFDAAVAHALPIVADLPGLGRAEAILPDSCGVVVIANPIYGDVAVRDWAKHLGVSVTTTSGAMRAVWIDPDTGVLIVLTADGV